MILLKNVNLFNGVEEEIKPQVHLLIHDGKIEKIADEYESISGERWDQEIDGRGRTVLPGLINVHVHLSLDPETEFVDFSREAPERTLLKMVKNVRETIEAGITTVRDLGARGHMDFILREAVEQGMVPGPRMVLCGRLITKTGGHGYILDGREADGPAEIMKAVREQVKAGADVIKVMSTGGVMTPGVDPGLALYSLEEIEVAVEEARRNRRPTASHAQGTEGIQNAVEAGIDTIEHGIFLTEEVVDRMIERGTYLVPTFAPGEYVFGEEAERLFPAYALEKGRQVIPIHRERFEKFGSKEGLKLGLGTDAGVPLVRHSDMVTELEIYTRFGFSNFEVLRLATYGNAELLGMEDRIGSLEEGKCADLILVDGDPLQDLSVLSAPNLVIRDGRIYRET